MNIALLLAAGKGSRMHSDIPKQFIKINDKTIYETCLDHLFYCTMIDLIVVVCDKEHLQEINRLSHQKANYYVIGGKTRQESVYRGLAAIKTLKEVKKSDIVLIHDVARCNVTDRLIRQNINRCLDYRAAVTAIPVSDTILQIKDEVVNEVPNRTIMYAAQTPQTFKFDLILKLHQKARADRLSFTDDCGLATHYHQKVYLVPGYKENIKVTTKEDLYLLQSILDNEHKN